MYSINGRTCCIQYGYEGNYSVINCACYIICCGFLLPFTKRIANKKMESVVAQASSAGSLQRFFIDNQRGGQC